MNNPHAIRLLVRFVGILAISGWLWFSPFRERWVQYGISVLLFFAINWIADAIFERSRGAADVGADDPTRFEFPLFSDEDIRNARMRSFVVGAIIAILPAVFNAAWRWFDNGTILDEQSYKQALPDFAIAGVGITISAYTNTVYSIARLKGDHGTGKLTFSCLVAGALCALLCFLAYLKANHAPPASNEIPRMFYASLTLAVSSFVLSYAAVASFVADELRGARALRRKLPVTVVKAQS